MQTLGFKISKIFSTFFFVGIVKKAPGTFGTLAAVIVIYPFLDQISMKDAQYLTYAFFLLGTIAAAKYMQVVKRDDPKEVVIDEVVGVWLCLFLNKFLAPEASIHVNVVASFVLFRFFDILKPFPISYVDKHMKNALGVMLDDVLAGIFASIVFVVAVKILL